MNRLALLGATAVVLCVAQVAPAAGPPPAQPVGSHAASGAVSQPASFTLPANLSAQVDSMVAQLLAASPVSTRGVEGAAPLVFDGVAWETGEGVNAGTSRFGTGLNESIRSSLASRGVPSETGGVSARGLGGHRFLSGGFKVLKSGLQISLAIVDGSTGLPVSKVSKVLANALSVATGEMKPEDLLPPNSDNLKGLARLIRESVLEPHASFSLRVTTDRGAQPAYVVGEQLHVLVEADRDCFLRLYHVAASDQTMTLIFPNRQDRDSRVPAGTRKVVPAAGTGVEFEVSEPAGVDAIVAIASERPFEDEALVNSGLGAKASEALPAQFRDVASVGPYLAAPEASDQRAKEIFSRGLLVRLPAPGGSAPGATASLGLDASSRPVPAGADSSHPGGSSTPAPADSAARQKQSPVARAVCFFTTLSRPKAAK